jgi:hypothetical protein
MCLPERPAGAGHQALGIGHVRRAIGVNMHLEMRKARDQVAGPTRVIEVHMREQDMPDIREPHA